MAKISVIVTCYNLEKYLFECIDSINSQTHPVDEIIVVHDGCSEPKVMNGTECFIKSKNTGVANSRKEGVALSTGDYLLFLDADDVLPENFIQEMKKTLEVCDIAYPSVLLWSKWGTEKPLPNGWFEPANAITKSVMKKMNQLVVSSMMKRIVYEKVGDFDPSLPVFEDYDFWLRALLAGFKFRKARTYLKYRQRTNGRNQGREEIKVKTYGDIVSRYKNELK